MSHLGQGDWMATRSGIEVKLDRGLQAAHRGDVLPLKRRSKSLLTCADRMSSLLEEAAPASWAAEALGLRGWQESPGDPSYCPLPLVRELQGQVRTALSWRAARVKSVCRKSCWPSIGEPQPWLEVGFPRWIPMPRPPHSSVWLPLLSGPQGWPARTIGIEKRGLVFF